MQTYFISSNFLINLNLNLNYFFWKKARDEKELQDETIETVEVDGVTLLDTSPV